MKHVSFKIGITLGICFAIAGCGPKEAVDYGPQNTQVIATNAPEPVNPSTPLDFGLEKSLTLVENWHVAVDREVNRLETYVQSTISKPERATDFSAPRLTYWGMDRISADETFSDQGIVVARWRRKDSAPEPTENGLNGLTGNLYEPWMSCNDFRTELTAHDIRRSKNELNVMVVAKTSGEVEPGQGLHATTLLQCKFQVRSEVADEIDLVEIKVSAHEEIRSSAEDAQLFHDVTRNVLQLDETLAQQIGYGVDEWARWIPGINLLGHQGIAIGDIDNDGLEDLYVCQPHGLPNILFRQNPDGTVDNLAEPMKVNLLDESRAALFVDLDNDGDDDLVVSTSQELILLSNSGQGEFQMEHRLLAGYDGGSLSAADFDNDGDLDIHVCKYHSILHDNDLIAKPNDFGNASNGGRNVLLRNNEGWKFEDVTEQVGLNPQNNRFSRSAVWTDYDLDGDQDLYVVNEFACDVLYENKDGWFGVFDEETKVLTDNTSSTSASIGDYNADGRPDIFVASNSLPEAARLKSLLDPEKEGLPKQFLASLSRGDRTIYSSVEPKEVFTSYRLPSPIFSSQSVFSSAPIDVNNDGLEDIMLTNGGLSRDDNSALPESEWIRQAMSNQNFGKSDAKTDTQRFDTITRALTERIRKGVSFAENQRNSCLLGMGQLGFANFSSAAGIDGLEDARGIVTVDWDHDGDLDVITTSRNAPQVKFFQNVLKSDNQYVAFELVGTKSNRDAIGARVELFLKDRESPLVKFVSAGSGAFSQSSKILHFGVAEKFSVEKAVVHWPSGLEQSYSGVKTNTRYELVEGAAELAELSNSRFDIDLLAEVETSTNKALGFTRSIFYPPSGLPHLEFQSGPQAWIRLKNIDRMPMLVCFLDATEASADILRDLERESKEISRSKLDVVAIRIDIEDPDSQAIFNDMEKMTANAEFPFRFGVASESMLHKLRMLYGEWYSMEQVPDKPFAWLIDREGLVRIVYPPGNVRADRALKDLSIISGGLVNAAKRASPRPGIWLGSTPATNYGRISARMRDLGYLKEEKRYAELSRPYLAKQICRSAIELNAKGDKVSARAEFASALDFDPRCELACVEYGKFLLVEAQNETDEVMRISLLNEAEVLFDKAIDIEPSNVQAVMGRAEVAKFRNQERVAIKQLEDFLEINPDHWEVHAIIGRLYFDQNEYVEATSYLLKAFKNRPTLPFVAGDLGFLYLNAGLYEDARRLLMSANKLQPSAVNLKRHLAQAEFLTGNYDSSVEIYRQVVVEQPNEIIPKSILAWILSTCPFESLRNGEEGLELATNLVKIHDDLASCHEVCAAAYAEIGDFENALMMQQKAVDMIENDTTPEVYSDMQKEGLKIRLENYKRKSPTRMSDFRKIPIRQPGT